MPARYKILTYFAVWFILLVFTVSPCYSATAPTFSGLPSSTSVEDEIELDVSFSGNPRYYKEKSYYLRGVFFQSGAKYCSLTQNNSGSWIGTASDTSKLFAFTTNLEGSWSGKLKVKIDKDNSNCSGSGEYQFKVGRYTSGSATWSNIQSLDVINPTPEPTPTPTNTSTPTPSSSPSTPENESGSDENEDEKGQVSPDEKGVVAGHKTTVASPTSTHSGDLEILPISPATFSAIEVIDEDPLATESGESGGWVNTPMILGSTLTASGIVAYLLKRYNIISRIRKRLWKKTKS